jgi:hypothetical protein
MLQAALRMTAMLLALAGAACVAMGPAFVPAAPPSNDRALLYLYREDTQPGNAVGMTISLDGQETATLYRRGYTRFYAKPGMRSIGVKLGLNAPRTYQVELKSGDTRYFRLATHHGTGPYSGGTVMEFTPVVSAAGEREVVFYRFQEPLQQEF